MKFLGKDKKGKGTIRQESTRKERKGNVVNNIYAIVIT